MKYLFIIPFSIIVLMISSCNFEELPILEENPYEYSSDVEILKVTGHSTQLYLGNEWEAFVEIELMDEYITDDMEILINRDDEFLTSIRVPNFRGTFNDRSSFDATHCYSFRLFKPGEFSKFFVEDYCVDFN